MLDFYVADVIFRWCMDRSMRDVPSDVRWIFSVHLILDRPWLKPRRQRCAQGQISHLQARHQLKLLYPLKPWRRRPQTATTPPDEATPRLLATAVWPMTDVPHQGGPRVQVTGRPSLVTHALTPVPHRWRMSADASPSWVTHDCWRQSWRMPADASRHRSIRQQEHSPLHRLLIIYTAYRAPPSALIIATASAPRITPASILPWVRMNKSGPTHLKCLRLKCLAVKLSYCWT